MATIKLRHINRFTDRHGAVRIYFRPPGCKAIALPGPIGSPEFMDAYNEAVTQPFSKVGIPLKAGSLAALAMSYFNSTAFTEKRPETQRSERGIINRLVDQYGSGKVSDLNRDYIQRIIDKKANTPSAARNLLAVMRILMAHAVKVRMRRDNPAVGVTRPKIKGKGFRSWTDEDAAKFKSTHPVGTRARLAYELAACTGLRRSDVVHIGRQHVRKLAKPVEFGTNIVTHELCITQQKTGSEVAGLLILPPLQSAIDALPADNMTFLITKYGGQFTKESYGNWFHDCCLEAGLSGLATHGLRKRMGARLADQGCSERQIAAVLGHTDLRQVRRYTEAANKQRMARDALLTLARERAGTSDLQTGVENLQPPLRRKGK